MNITGKNKIKLLFFIFFLGITKVNFSQDIQFSQFYSNHLFLNPAMAGYKICPQVALNYRNQWAGLGNAFATYSASYDQNIDFLKGGVGVLVYQDNQGAGAISQTNFETMYSYYFQVKRNLHVRAALQASYLQLNINSQSLIFSDMVDLNGNRVSSNEALPSQHSSAFDVATGVAVFGKNFYGGIAIHHLLQPFLGEQLVPLKTTVHFGMNFSVDSYGRRKEDYSFSPNIIIQQQQSFQQINYGIYFTKNYFTFGTWFRQSITKFGFNADAFIFLVGFSTQKFRIGYSYDLTVSKLYKSTMGSHEISFNYQFDCYELAKKQHIVRCPKF